MLGPYRENAFYLLPISAYFQKADLLIDFARNRTGFKLIEFPEEVKVDLVEKDPDHDKETDQPVSIDVLNTMVLREYGVDLSQVKQK